MNNLQRFVQTEAHIRKLLHTLATDDCESCPAHKFCLRDGKRAEPKYDDCGDAFVAWALQTSATKAAVTLARDEWGEIITILFGASGSFGLKPKAKTDAKTLARKLTKLLSK